MMTVSICDCVLVGCMWLFGLKYYYFHFARGSTLNDASLKLMVRMWSRMLCTSLVEPGWAWLAHSVGVFKYVFSKYDSFTPPQIRLHLDQTETTDNERINIGMRRIASIGYHFPDSNRECWDLMLICHWDVFFNEAPQQGVHIQLVFSKIDK